VVGGLHVDGNPGKEQFVAGAGHDPGLAAAHHGALYKRRYAIERKAGATAAACSLRLRAKFNPRIESLFPSRTEGGQGFGRWTGGGLVVFLLKLAAELCKLLIGGINPYLQNFIIELRVPILR
jgi:hypothetical protein